MKERLPDVMKWRLVREGYDVSKGLHGPAGNLRCIGRKSVGEYALFMKRSTAFATA